MTIADQNERVLTQYPKTENILSIHEAIRDNVRNEAEKSTQCLIIIHAEDNINEIQESRKRREEVIVYGFTYVKKIYHDIDIRDAEIKDESLDLGSVPSDFYLAQSMSDSYFNENGAVHLNSIAHGTFSDRGLDIPIFFPTIPSEEFTPESLYQYLRMATLDVVDALYASNPGRYAHRERIRVRSQIRSKAFSSGLREFSEKFLLKTKNVEHGIRVIEK